MLEVRYIPQSKQYFFRMAEGKLLGHIVPTQVVNIDLERVEALTTIPLLMYKKTL